MPQPVIKISDLSFLRKSNPDFVMNIAQFEQKAGENILLLGESGSGKSTLLSLIAGLEKPQDGHIFVAGKALNSLSKTKIDQHRALHLGIIFQQLNLLPYLSVYENITLPLKFASLHKSDIDTLNEVKRLCTQMNLPLDVLNKAAGKLSVGQQQRVACARAMIGQPKLIIADEPTSALDSRSQDRFLELLFQESNKKQCSILLVSHDKRLARYFDRTVEMGSILKPTGKTK